MYKTVFSLKNAPSKPYLFFYICCMVYRLKIIILFISLILSTHIQAQEHYVFSSISSINGLSDNRVRTLCQLPDRRMIVVTEGLVNIYDGVAFRYMHYDEQ